MKIQYRVEQLEKGMYVSELDRPWVGTPFLFQGFIIESDEELTQLRQLCKHVFVDDLKSSTDLNLQKKLHSAVRGSTITVEFQEWKGLEKLRETISKIKTQSDDTVVRLTQYAESDPSDRREHFRETRGAVTRLIDNISADPQTSQWMRILSEQDASMGRHAMNTTTLAVSFAGALGWDAALKAVVGEGAMLHDIGMAKIPKQIRDKPGKLSKDEYNLIKLHPGYAADKLANNTELDPRILEIVRHHHERLDGSGYPDGLKDDMIPEYVQLVSICDVYDSYITDQCYREKLTSSAAVARITKRSIRHFSKELVEKFIRWIGIYPLGSLVYLRNKSLAIIVASDEKKRLQPTVLLVRDADGKALLPRRTLNLGFIESAGLSAEWGLREIVDPKTVQINVRQILLQELQMR
ncbi:MAG: HD domain-containing phosphohydrolase [Gammaproteobacteria bacterium]